MEAKPELSSGRGGDLPQITRQIPFPLNHRQLIRLRTTAQQRSRGGLGHGESSYRKVEGKAKTEWHSIRHPNYTWNRPTEQHI
jgi:hypothetical protein